jgi:hypothetical protein
MKKLSELVERDLEWVQPSAARREFELRDGGDVVATLRFRSALGSFATAETAEGSWTFKRVGFWSPRVTVCVAGTDREIASFRNNTWTGGGTLELSGGRALRASTNLWMSNYDFRNEADEPLVRYRKLGGLIHLSAKVEILRAAAGVPELSWLVVFAWYLAIKMRDDAASGAAAGAAAAG